MERLTLEDAICHAREVVKCKSAEATYNFAELSEYYDECKQCAEEHNQLAEWLEELKLYKDIGTPKELKELKENGAFTGLELAKLAIMQKELQEYKDLEERGLLVKLPCKIGDIVYTPTRDFIFKHRITTIFHDLLGIYFNGTPEDDADRSVKWFAENDLGKTVFLTREEAAKKLEESQNDKT